MVLYTWYVLVFARVSIYIYILFIRLYDDNSLQWSESDIVKVECMQKEFEKKKIYQ